MTIGFIGIGVMGLSMARHLMQGGHALRVYTRTASKAAPLVQEGALQFGSVGECVRGCQAVITIVGYPGDVEEVYTAPGGILDSADKGALVIDMTTSSALLWQGIAKKARERGLRPLDAPVSGGDVGARNATLTIMVGGDEADFLDAKPLFDLMGRTLSRMGGDGMGQHTKMANQIAIAGALAGVAEAVAYGEGVGLDTQKMLTAISAGSATSWQMTYNGPKKLRGDWAPGFYLTHFAKDLRLALEGSRQSGLHLRMLETVLSEYASLEEAGMGDLGTQALIRHYRGEDAQG
ncbi:MAG TPA: NAD(P)-dependent oxidoreductase [Candidatus Limnocylindria bacterium]|nr:NAD(P)-dependent oxidoreductase [Candidatus Limnocylindria bacterium]